MTQLKPSLFVNRLVVFKDGNSVYDEVFHRGVNIISGKNGSGKSLIFDLLFYALGGEVKEWKYPASVCDFVCAEIVANGNVITVRRAIQPDNPYTSMDIYFGELNDSSKSGISGWLVYPYKASENKESFSQKIFSALSLPIFKTDNSVNITINQLLRLICSDQLTPGGKIFKHQEAWDSAFLREAVGELLCGIYDVDLYDAKLNLINKNKSLDSCISQLRSIFSILGNTDQSDIDTNFQEKIIAINNKLDALNIKIIELRQTAIIITAKAGKKNDQANAEIAAQLASEAEKERLLQYQISEISLEIIDSKNFVSELNRRIDSLNHSEKISMYLGNAKFSACPCCMTPIKRVIPELKNSCELCKESFTSETKHVNYLRMLNEVTAQARESERNIITRQAKQEALQLQLTTTIDAKKSLYRKLQTYTKTFTTEAERDIDAANFEIGRLNQELSNIREKEKLHAFLTKLKVERDQLNHDVFALKDIINSKANRQMRRRSEIYGYISELIANILQKDLPREEVFINAKNVSIDFPGNSVIVDGVGNFSASSLVFLKNAFHLSMLISSCTHEYMRYPRFAVLDGIEDGGMEDARSHNFQKILVEYSKNIPTEHQIIYTTAKIAPEFENSSMQVGPFYDKAVRKTIKLNNF